MVLVKKKYSSLRCHVDYCKLNSVTRKDVYPLHRIDDCLDAMVWQRYSAHLISKARIIKLRLHLKITFICFRHMYRYKTMPFGLCSASVTFHCLMDVVTSGLHLEVCLVYLNDIILMTSFCFQNQLGPLGVLNQSPWKVVIGWAEAKTRKMFTPIMIYLFLGHVISEEGIVTDLEKIKTVTEWPEPTTVKEVQSFLGLAGYRNFVKNYANITAPLHMHCLRKINLMFGQRRHEYRLKHSGLLLLHHLF